MNRILKRLMFCRAWHIQPHHMGQEWLISLVDMATASIWFGCAAADAVEVCAWGILAVAAGNATVKLSTTELRLPSCSEILAWLC